jgi:hypothetical protein
MLGAEAVVLVKCVERAVPCPQRRINSNERRKRHATCDINISHKDGSRQAQHVIETRNEAIYAGHRN